MKIRCLVSLALLLFPVVTQGETRSVAVSPVGAAPVVAPNLLVLVSKKGEPLCLAAPVAPEWVLCPAHCLESEPLGDLKLVTSAPDGKKNYIQLDHIVFYDASLKSGEQPNFDLAMVKMRQPSGMKPDMIPSIAPLDQDPAAPGELRGWSMADDGAMIDNPMQWVATIDSSRLFHLLQLGMAQAAPHERRLLRNSVVYRLAPGGPLLLGIAAAAPAALYDGQRGLFYTDVRRYQDFIKDVLTKGAHQIPELPRRGTFASFADWCTYANYHDDAWNTVQRLLWSMAAKVGTYPLKLFTDCPYAAQMAMVQARKEIRFTGDKRSRGALRSLEPLAGLGVIRSLAFYFDEMNQLKVPSGLMLERVDIVATRFDEASLCELMEHAVVKSLGLWQIQESPVTLDCLMKSHDLKDVDLAYSKLKNSALLGPLSKKVDLRFSP